MQDERTVPEHVFPPMDSILQKRKVPGRGQNWVQIQSRILRNTVVLRHQQPAKRDESQVVLGNVKGQEGKSRLLRWKESYQKVR